MIFSTAFKSKWVKFLANSKAKRSDTGIQVISFYEFKSMDELGELTEIRTRLRKTFVDLDVHGTIIIAAEGFNGMVCGTPDTVTAFVKRIEDILDTQIYFKSSFHTLPPFRRIEVRIKPEIVSLRKSVDLELGKGTHVNPRAWNAIISDPDTLVLDARNDYEYRTGTFKGAMNPGVAKFSELPLFVAKNLDPVRHKRIAMFCTGGIRCEKFAPYMKQIGFPEVYQLDGGILKYLEDIPAGETLWEGECFVFDDRVSLDHDLSKGGAADLSQRRSGAKPKPS